MKMFIRLTHGSPLMFSRGSSFFPHVKTEPVRCGHSNLELSISFSFGGGERREVYPVLTKEISVFQILCFLCPGKAVQSGPT